MFRSFELCETRYEELARYSSIVASILETKRIYRAYYSAITAPDIHKAMRTLKDPNENEAHAVDARQELDLKGKHLNPVFPLRHALRSFSMMSRPAGQDFPRPTGP